MRHRKDTNQDEIVKALRKKGATVYVIGRPVDLVCGYKCRNFLIDVKSANGKKTPFQKTFFEEWRGQVRIVRSVKEAIDLVTESYDGSRVN